MLSSWCAGPYNLDTTSLFNFFRMFIRIKDKWSPTGYRDILVVRNRKGSRPRNRVATTLEIEQDKADVYKVQHAFRRRRSALTNAMAHVGRNYTMTMRLSGLFFRENGPAIQLIAKSKPDMLLKLRLSEPGMFSAGGRLAPAMSNLIAAPMDNQISRMNRTSRFGRLFVYTRYAEALYFSYDGQATGDLLRQVVPPIAIKWGLCINEAHTRVQCATAGRRIISGFGVDNEVHWSRKNKRRSNKFVLPMVPKGYVETLVPLGVRRSAPSTPAQPETPATTPSKKGRKFDLD